MNISGSVSFLSLSFLLTLCSDQADYCDWTYDNKQLTRLSPSTSNTNQTPAIDHTLGSADGHYLKVGVVNQNVQLTYNLSMSSSSSNKCIKFYYYMSSPTKTSQDYYYVQTIEYKWGDWSAHYMNMYGLLNHWQYHRLTLKDVSASDVVIIGAKISDQSTVLAFDDILVQDVACEEPGWCDFENGLSSYAIT